MIERTGMVLEGGGSRGIFTAGAIDYLIEQDMKIPYVIGVSAGACNAVDYVSGQIGRTRECMIVKEKAYRYVSMRNMIKQKSLFDMDMIFDKFPNQYIPFDYDVFFHSGMICEITVTNCITGKAEYYSERRDKERLMQLCRASSSLPVAAPMVFMNGVPYLDGGIGNSIPIGRSIRVGNRKHIVILTRKEGYRKRTDNRKAAFIKRYYRGYPRLIQSILRRPYVYNRTLDLMDELEKQGKIFVIRPRDKIISKVERKPEKLEEFYRHGYEQMKERFDDLMCYLQL